MLSIDLPEHGARKKKTGTFDPWHVVPELQAVITYARQRWEHISLRANSIGAWFSILAFGEEPPKKSQFVSPVLNMAHLIQKMMQWAGITEAELHARERIETAFGETLSWKYYQYAKEYAIESWACPTAILYAAGDHLTGRQEVDSFVTQFHCDLTVVENSAHWFHTPEQLEVLR